ncbi:lebercilin-like protein [Vipera latastei]
MEPGGAWKSLEGPEEPRSERCRSADGRSLWSCGLEQRSEWQSGGGTAVASGAAGVEDLEKQLSLNTTSFNHQLAVAKKQTAEAQLMTANLQVEIELLKLKLKEFISLKLLGQNISYGTFMGLQSEETGSRTEKNTQHENRERQKSGREREGLDLFKEELNKLKVEPSFFPTNHVMPKVNHLEDKAMEKQENEDKEAKEAVCDKVMTPIPSHRPTTFKKHYVFTEATENLHQGYPSTGPLLKPKMPCSGRRRI